jgi:thioredoxin 1
VSARRTPRSYSLGNAIVATVVEGRMSNVTHLTDATFAEAIGSADKPVLVDFTAAWCGPCKTISPILDELSIEQADKLQIAKIDVDDNPQTTLRYDVMSMPTLILFKDGEPQRKLIGARGKQHLLNDLADVL